MKELVEKTASSNTFPLMLDRQSICLGFSMTRWVNVSRVPFACNSHSHIIFNDCHSASHIYKQLSEAATGHFDVSIAYRYVYCLRACVYYIYAHLIFTLLNVSTLDVCILDFQMREPMQREWITSVWCTRTNQENSTRNHSISHFAMASLCCFFSLSSLHFLLCVYLKFACQLTYSLWNIYI